jgi:HD-GYP domain-containing protein (c-di-GMP phosphodiesterase class II)
MERDTLTQVKSLQALWQELAKTVTLLQRDERALWEQFRAACDAVFSARTAKRKEEDGRKHEQRRSLEELCARLEQAAAAAADKTDQDLRRVARELQDAWRAQSGRLDPSLQGVESRFRHAKAAIDTVLTGRSRSREAAVWQTLAAKEQLCEELDRRVLASDTVEGGPLADPRWDELPALPPAWEKKIAARRDAALRALAEPTAAGAHRARIERGGAARADALLELEMALGLDSPAELQAQRLALQVRQLRDRFQGAASSTANAPGERLLAWCAEPGVADPRDRERLRRILSAIERMR